MAGLHCKDAPPLTVCNPDFGVMDLDLFLMHDWERARCCRLPASQESSCLRLIKSLLHFEKKYVLVPIPATCVGDARALLALRVGENESGEGVRSCVQGEPGAAGRAAGDWMVSWQRRRGKHLLPLHRDIKSPESSNFFQRTVSGSKHLFPSNLSLSFHFCPQQCLDSPSEPENFHQESQHFH